MKPHTRNAFAILRKAGAGWVAHDAATLGAALAYYAVFSVAPILIIAIAISGFVYGEAAARGQIVEEIGGLVGEDGGKTIESLIEHAGRPGTGLTATVAGTIALLFGASGVFVQLHNSLNKIWGVSSPPGRGIITWIRRRFLSFAMTLTVGFLLLVSLALTAWLAVLTKAVKDFVPETAWLGQTTDLGVSFVVITLLFALIFKVLPDTPLRWRDAFGGAVVTALLFSLGKHLLGLYLGTSAITSSFGAAGSLIALLLWIYYSAQILYFGAEITKACHDVAEAQGARRMAQSI